METVDKQGSEFKGRVGWGLPRAQVSVLCLPSGGLGMAESPPPPS